MKRLLVCLLVLVACTLFLTPASSFAQTQPATPEQSLQELVKEVRQLRATLQRMNAAVYKGQVMLGRLKLHQEQVNLMERELRETRESLSEMRGEEAKLKEMLGRANAGVETGAVHERERASLKAELRVMNQRQQRAMMRVTELTTELTVERAKLIELNHKLNTLESEL